MILTRLAHHGMDGVIPRRDNNGLREGIRAAANANLRESRRRELAQEQRAEDQFRGVATAG